MATFCARLAVLICLLAPAFLFAPKTAQAEGFALYQWGARGTALAGAMVARTPDASAVAYNPALLTGLPGKQVMAGVVGVRPTARIYNVGYGETRNKTEIHPIPHLYYTHQINDDLFFGIGLLTRFGLGLTYPSDWPGRFNTYDVGLTTLSLNPSLAWKATERLSLGLGLEVMYVSLDLKRRSRVPFALPIAPGVNAASSMEVDAKISDAQGWGIGGNVGMHYQINDQWAVGIHYRSPVQVRANGDITFANLGIEEGRPGAGNPVAEAGANAGFNQNFRNGTARSTVTLPDSIAFGIAWEPTPKLSVEAGGIWTRWSTFDSLDIEMPGDLPTSVNPKKWKDVWRLNVGVEYQALDWLILRAGYAWDQAPHPKAWQDYLSPTDDRHVACVGLGFQWSDAWTLDLAYSYIRPKNRFYRDDPPGMPGSRPNASGTVRGSTRNMYTQVFEMSLGYRW